MEYDRTENKDITQPKFCMYCGKEMGDGVKFCPYCGITVTGKIVKSKKMLYLFMIKWTSIVIIVLTIIFILAMVWITGDGSDHASTEDLEMLNKDRNVSIAIDSLEVNNVDEVFISDYVEMPIDGISQANKADGGWVTEQGDWNYYVISERISERKHYILKENIITDERYQVMSSNDSIYEISVMGDWIYLCTSVDCSCVERVRTDGKYHEKLMLNTQEEIKEWFTYNGNFYAIISKHMSASQVEDFIVNVDWESGTYVEIYNCGIEGAYFFVGAENGYAFFAKENKIQESYSDVFYEYEFKRVSLDCLDEDNSLVTYSRWKGESAPNIWRIYDDSIFGVKGDYGWITDWTENYFFWKIDFADYRVYVYEFPELNDLRYETLLDFNLNFYNEAFLMGMNGIMVISEGETFWNYRTISEDRASDISVANNRIYYQSRYNERNMFCYIDEAGEWHELRIEDFIPIG